MARSVNRGRRALSLALGSLAAAGGASARGALAAERIAEDDAGRRVRLAAAPARVFPAGAPAAVYLYCLAPDRLVGWPRALRADEAAWLLPRVRGLPELGRLSGRGSTAKLETLLATRSELVVDVGSVTPTYVSLAEQVQRQAGVPYLLFDGALRRTEQTVRRLGEVLGASERAYGLARRVRAVLDDAAQLRAAVPPGERPRVYFARGAAGLVTAGPGTLSGELLDEVAAVNVAVTQAPNLAQVSLEQVIGWAPDWIVATDPSFVASIDRHPVWSRLPAVRARRVLLAPRLPFGWFDAPPALNRLAGLVWLSSVLHPARARRPLDETMVDLFEWLYLHRPSIADMRELLASARMRDR